MVRQPTVPITIREACTPDDYQAFARLIGEYVEWCRDRDASIDMAFAQQSLNDELSRLSQAYGPPHGRTLLAVSDGEVCGAVAYRACSADVCEMKRLFTTPRCRGLQVGRDLCAKLMECAVADGFRQMRLDAARNFTEAIGLYRRLGFVECEAFFSYPPALQPLMMFMERSLLPQAAPGASGTDDTLDSRSA